MWDVCTIFHVYLRTIDTQCRKLDSLYCVGKASGAYIYGTKKEIGKNKNSGKTKLI